MAWIESLEAYEVFVFGSNADGSHAAGAALTAYRRFGAVWGQGNGMQGQAYGIDTMSGPEEMALRIAEFVEFARGRTDLRFLLTPIGTGIAGYAAADVAPHFLDAPANVVLPDAFLEVLRGLIAGTT